MNTLEECITGFKQYLYIEKNYSSKTVSTYESNLRSFTGFLHKSKSTVYIGDIKDSEINDYIIYYKTVLNNKPSTINLKISTLKSFYKYLVEKGIIDMSANITYNLKQQKLPKKLPLYLTYEEAENLLLGTKLLSNNSCRDYALLCLFLMTGARLTEVEGLSLEQISFTDKSITFFGKGSKERTVPLIERAEIALKDYINQRSELVGTKIRTVFLSRYKRPLTARGVQNIITNLLKSTGIYRKGLSVHKLRHTCFTLLYRSGVDLLTIKKIAGHENIKTTEIYTHLNDKDLLMSMQKNPLGLNNYDDQFIQKIKDKYFNKK